MWRHSKNDETPTDEIIAAVHFVIVENLYNMANDLAIERLIDKGDSEDSEEDDPILSELIFIIESCVAHRWDEDYSWFRPRMRFINRARYFLKDLTLSQLLTFAIQIRMNGIDAHEVPNCLSNF